MIKVNIAVLNKIVMDFSTKVAEILKDNYKDNLVSVCLFGSAAMGRLREGSDIDFMAVLKKTNLTYYKRINLYLIDYIIKDRKLQKLMDRTVENIYSCSQAWLPKSVPF